MEPIEEYLGEGFTTRSFRTPSHKSTRLTVPHMIGNTGVRSGLTETAIFGDSIVPRPNVELGGDQPLVVLANPLFNVTDEDDPDLHESLRGNRSYYFDGPERFETQERVFGFGPHGLETRIVGTTTDVFILTLVPMPPAPPADWP